MYQNPPLDTRLAFIALAKRASEGGKAGRDCAAFLLWVQTWTPPPVGQALLVAKGGEPSRGPSAVTRKKSGASSFLGGSG